MTQNTGVSVSMAEEETLVAELEQLGVRYIARQVPCAVTELRAPDLLLADLIRQPSARVRGAVIAVLLAHPEFASAVLAALSRLSPPEGRMLRYLYTAACLLQEEYADRLKRLAPTDWQRLPDLFSSGLGLPTAGTPRERLNLLGDLCQRDTGTIVNWAGSYEHVARQLLRRWEVEATSKK
jgi:hypothetical protein